MVYNDPCPPIKTFPLKLFELLSLIRLKELINQLIIKNIMIHETLMIVILNNIRNF